MFVSPMPDRLTVGGVTFEFLTKGEGRPLLFLHGAHGADADDPLIERLSKSYKVIAASHPGYGLSTRPEHVTTVEDVVYSYLDLIEKLDLKDVVLVGASLGGWIAAELAVRGSSRFSQLILIDAVGAKFGDRETRAVTDIFAYTSEQLPDLLFADRDAGLKAMHGLKFMDLPEEVSVRYARNRETLVLYGWSPTLFNPKLRQRLTRIQIPTLALWGDRDRIASPDYGRAYAATIPGARFELIQGAGHYGYFEEPDAYANAAIAFLGVGRAR